LAQFAQHPEALALICLADRFLTVITGFVRYNTESSAERTFSDTSKEISMPHARSYRLPSVQSLAWIFFAAVTIRFADLWAVAAGVRIPRIGSVGFTIVFSLFSMLHASSLLGWRRATAFLIASTTVSLAFEELGVETGFIYGHYHYGQQLGAAIGAVPIIIPLAWFMMIYCSWVVAHALLQGTAESASVIGIVAHSVMGSAVMTAWDVVMDPSMARTGTWIWEAGGGYFGVPYQNFVG
jgi:uncharacterized membrane protein